MQVLEDKVAGIVEAILAEGPCFLVEIAVRGSAGSHAIDIFVESDGVLDAHTLGNISREVGYSLDTEGIMPGRYTLNVSSPGADRPLRLPRQYRKMMGRDLRVHFRKSADKNAEVIGKLINSDSEGITVAVNSEALPISYGDILWAKVKLPW